MKATFAHKKHSNDETVDIACPLCGALYHNLFVDIDSYDEMGMLCDNCKAGGSLFLGHDWGDPYVWISAEDREKLKDRDAIYGLLNETRQEGQCKHTAGWHKNGGCIVCRMPKREVCRRKIDDMAQSFTQDWDNEYPEFAGQDGAKNWPTAWTARDTEALEGMVGDMRLTYDWQQTVIAAWALSMSFAIDEAGDDWKPPIAVPYTLEEFLEIRSTPADYKRELIDWSWNALDEVVL